MDDPRLRVILRLLCGAFLLSACGLVPETPAGLECQRVPANGGEVREGESPVDPNGPMAGLPVGDMTAEALGDHAESEGYGVTYRYYYDVGDQPENGAAGYSECWCVPPPGGRVSDVAYDAIGRIIVFVESGEHRDTVRPQPEQGWGCEDAPAPT